MDIKTRIKQLILTLLNNIHEKRKLILALSCLVVFITTYVLILPAFTLDKEEATEQGGIDVPGTELSVDNDAVSDKTDADASETSAEGEAEASAPEADATENASAGAVENAADQEATNTAENDSAENPGESAKKDSADSSADAAENDSAKGTAKEAANSSAKETANSSTKETAGKADNPSADSKAPTDVTLTNKEGDGFVVAVEGKNDILSDDMSVAVREIDQNDKKQKKEYESLYKDALEAVQEAHEEKGLEKPSDFAFAKFYDISLMNGKTEVEPDAAVDVKISFDKVLQKELKVTDPDRVHIVHFAVDKKTGEATPEVLDSDSTDITVKNNKVTEAAFTADSFSVFAVVYTVDFHYDVNGEQYDFSMDGGGFISLKSIVEALKVTDNAEDFVANIEKAEFSNPELVWVGKANNDTTVGELKAENGLEPEYTSGLTEEQIAETDAQTISAGEWVLISLKPFTSKETMTVTMKNGDQFVVKVTDYQIKKTVISDSGATYVVKVTYGSDAQIPEGAELKVREIASEEEAYLGALQDVKTNLTEGKENIPSHPVLFDIAIYHEGHEIEPAEGSEVKVEVKLAKNALKGMYTDEDSPLLINDMPITDDASQMEKQIQVLHLADDNQIDVVETKDTISKKEIASSFTTDSFSNWLLYLDEDLTSIDVTTGDSITLRPYTEWVWKHSDEPTEPIDYRDGQWTFPESDWNDETNWENVGTNQAPDWQNVHYYTHKTNGSKFRSWRKTDSQLNETYTVVTSVSLSATNGGFDLTTNKGKTIHVNVTQGSSSGKPGTVSGISGLKVNLYDYDVPNRTYQNGQTIPNTFDFTKSGNLDVQSNTASNPDNNNNINTNHDLKFIGWGGSNSNNNGGVNNYTNDNPHQNIVKNELGDNGYPKLNYGTNQNLSYLFNTESRNHNVYAFPDADGLFQLDNLGYYYYNSNANYAEYDRTNNKFILYEHTYSQNTGGSNGANAKPIGFFPFHEYDTADTQPEMNFNKNLNHHFGMDMTVSFEIPKDRRASDPSGYKHDIIYEFSGDDDLWVFVDDELVLDIGGIHQPVTGTINFTTGVISVHGVADKTINFDVGNHTLKMFYIERGGCDSNLSVRFNLPLTIGQGNVTIVKKSKTNDEINPDIPLEGAVFGIWDNPNCEGEPYTVATSDRNGIVFKNLPIREEGQKYYLREINPPDGYLLDRTIFTLTAGDKDANGDYTFIISNGDEVISEKDPTLRYPILRNQHNAPISITVHKSWENADGTEMEEVPEDLTAKFALKRKRTYSTDPLLTINLVSSNSSIGQFDTIYAHAGDILTIRYKHAPDGNNTAQCSTANGVQNVLALPTNSSGDPISVTYTVNADHASNDIIDIIIPSWFTDWCNGANYGAGDNPTFENIQSGSHNTVTDDDPDYEQEITLTAQDNWSKVIKNLAVQEKKNGIVYHYEYYIVEKDIPDGFEAIFYDSSGNPISDPSSQATNTSGTQEVVNRELLDVPIEKHWADFSGEAYTWTATFQLEEMEIKVNEADPDAPANEVKSDFVEIPGKKLTISKGQTPVPKFTDLPMYRVHSNGTVYRILYSVSEIGYTIMRNGTIVAQWGVDANGDELEIIGDTRYEPQFEQDAGEHGSTIDDYKIRIVNMMKTRILDKEIDLTVQKTWPEGSSYVDSGETYAKFVLKRYVHQEYRDYSKVAAGTEWKTITLKTWQNDETKDQTVTVPVNTEVHITGSIKPSTNANRIRFTQSSGQEDLILVQNNTENAPYPFDITVTADQDKTIHLAQGDNYVIGGRDGFRLSDTYGNKTQDVPDSTFEEAFTLNKDNNWTAAFEYLPQIEEQDIDPTTGSQTIFVFTYYLEETECNPADFYPVFTDASGLVVGGNNNSRIDYSTTLTAENKQKTTDITLKKVAKDQLDATDPPTLKKAAFRIEKYTSNTFQDKDDSWGNHGDKVLTDINNNGVFSLEGLPTGYYKIVETAFPDGYVKLSEDPIFEVRLNSETKELEVVLLNADATEATDNQTEMVRVNDMTILFGNTPGTALPHTGGMGTIVFYIIGFILIIGSGLLLWRRRRTI